jgi:hypothetical protein
MSVKPQDFKYEIFVYLDDIGECLVCFDILTPSVELDPDHSDDYEIDFAVFDAENDKHITYDINRKQYNHCENKAMDEMRDITTKWKKEWEEYMYD